jgi:hypothetical protein
MADNGGGNCSGLFAVASTNNLATNSTCSPDFSQVSSVDLALGDLSGNPAYFPLNSGSTAIDTGTKNGCPAVDEMGKHRPQYGNDDGMAICDVGAYEAWPIDLFDHAVYLPLSICN